MWIAIRSVTMTSADSPAPFPPPQGAGDAAQTRLQVAPRRRRRSARPLRVGFIGGVADRQIVPTQPDAPAGAPADPAPATRIAVQ